MASFMDYYQQELLKRGAPAGTSTPSRPRSAPVKTIQELNGGASQEKEETNPFASAANWVMDMLSRPTYGMTNMNKENLDRGAQGLQKIQSGDAIGGAVDIVSGISAMPSFLAGPGSNVILDLVKGATGNEANRTFVEGLTSNEPEKKMGNADLLEYGVDKLNEGNRNYENTENNIDAPFKGIVGFGLDVVGDPLTYLSGTGIARGASALAQGAKGLVQGAKASRVAPAVADATKVAEDAPTPATSSVDNAFEGSTVRPAPEAVPAASNFVDELVQQPAPRSGETGTSSISEAVENTFKKPSAPVEKTPKGTSVPLSASVEKVTEMLSTGEKLSEVLKTSPRVPEVQKQLKELSGILAPKAAGAADETAEMAPFPALNEWVKSAPEKVTINAPGDLITTTPQKARNIYMGELATANGGRVPTNQAEVAAAQKSLSPRGVAAYQAYTQAYKTAKDAHGSTAVQQIMDGVTSYQNRLQGGEAAFRNVLGDDIFELLLSKTSKEAATRTVLKMESIFGGQLTNLDAFLAKNPRIQGAVQGAFHQELDAVKAAPNTPEAVEELVAQVTELSPTSKVFAQVLRTENLPGTPEFLAKYGKISRTNPVAKGADQTADWWRKTNTFTQLSMFKKLQAHISDRVRSVSGLPREAMYGAQRASAQRQAVESMGRELVDTMETFGTPLHIGVKDDLVRLTFADVYEQVGRTMDEVFGDPDITNLALHNYGTSVAMSRLLNATQAAVVHPEMGVDEIAAFIRKKSLDSDGPNGGKALPNNISGTFGQSGGRGFHYTGKANSRARVLAERTGGTVRTDKKGSWLSYQKGGNLPEMLAEALVAARPSLAATAEKNAAEWAARGISEAQQLSGNELRALRTLATNETKAAQRELANRISRRKSDIAEDAARITATPEGTQAAVVATEADLGPAAIKEAEIVTAQERHLTEGMDFEEAGQRAMQERVNSADIGGADDLINEPSIATLVAEQADEGATLRETYETFDLGQKAALDIQSASAGALGERFNKAFNRNYQLNHMADVPVSMANAASRAITDAVIRPVKELARKYTPDTISQGIKAVQQGTKLDPASELGKAAAEVETIIGKLFDLDSTKVSAMGNIFMETGAHLEHINSTLRWALGGNTSIQLYRAEARRAAEEFLGKGATKAQIKARTEFELREQWRAWDFGTDPSNTLVSLGQAAGKVAERQATIASFVKTGKANGFVVEVPKGGKPPAGFVKVVDSRGDSSFGPLMPKNTFVSKEVAPELAWADYLLRASRQLSGEAGDFVRQTLIPMTNTWKQGMTIYRPGHHVRNMIGNWSLQFVSRGNAYMAQSSKATMKLMARRNDFEGLDAIASLRAMGDEAVPTGGDVLVKGRYGDITADEIWDAVNREGLLPTYASSEGLLSGEVKQGGIIERALRPLDADNNPVGRLGAAASQNIDHAQRVHHFVQALMQEASKRGGKWEGASKAEVFKKIATEVRRTHPDASMLTPFETKFMKLIIPFYSWLRGVLPGALESALTHPGRLAIFPKASYNLAVSLGINPDSMSDPFPEDQLFPSFITESALGPQFKIGESYIRVNPGIAHLDILETFGADPVRGVAGMVNPLFRAPAELLSGGSWSTGGRISDVSDYLDQSVPGLNYVANLSGVSPTGSIGSLVSGQGLDPQAQIAKGNKTDFDKALTLANWITGAGIQNLSRPNYINYAEIERRNEAGGK